MVTISYSRSKQEVALFWGVMPTTQARPRVQPNKVRARRRYLICSKYWGRRRKLSLSLLEPGPRLALGIKKFALRITTEITIRRENIRKIKMNDLQSWWASLFATNLMISRANSANSTISQESLDTAHMGDRAPCLACQWTQEMVASKLLRWPIRNQWINHLLIRRWPTNNN